MSKKKTQKKLFFSKTLDFLEHYLPDQVLKSRNTIETYRDALTIFRRYVTDECHLSIKTFGFEDCTHEMLLSYMEYLKNKKMQKLPAITGLPQSELICGMQQMLIFLCNLSHCLLQEFHS